MNIHYLRIPLNLLDDMADIQSFVGLTTEQLALIRNEYAPEEVQGIRDALQYAVEHPEFDFKKQFPELMFDNIRIHAFLCEVHRSMERSGLF